MDKNVYQLLHDWGELYKNGVITEEEFAAKKKELLGGEKTKQSLPLNENIRVLSYDEQREIDLEYDLLFNKKSWFKKNKFWLFIAFFTIIVSVFLYYKLKRDNTEDIEIELKTNVPINDAKRTFLILENNKKIRLDKFPEGDDYVNTDIRDSAIRCLIDLDNDNIPELVTEYFTGGAHCCDVSDIFIKLSDNTYKRVFSYNGSIALRSKTLGLYFYEDLGYFNTCYACGVEVKMPFNLSPEINLIFKNKSFEFAEKSATLNEGIEENLKTLKAKGIPNMTNDDFSQDDGTRKEYALNIVSYFFNTDRNLTKTKELFYSYYNHDDKNRIWNQLEEYLNAKNLSLKKSIKFKTD